MFIPLRLEYSPETISDQGDIEAPIREALATQDRGTVTVEVSGATLTLTWCDYADRTPIWDQPLPDGLGKISARRPDGVEASWAIGEVPTWEALTRALIEFQDGWGSDVMYALSEAHGWAREARRLQDEMRRVRGRLTQAMAESERVGAPARMVDLAIHG